MSTGPDLFSDFGKNATDLLTENYGTENKISLRFQAKCGVTIASSLLKKGGISAGGFAGQCSYNYKYKNTSVDLNADTDSNNIAATVTLTDILPITKTNVKCWFPDYNNTGKIEVQFLPEYTSLTTSVDLKKSPSVDISATIGTPVIALGSSLKVNSCAVTEYNVGVNLTKPNYGASVILADRGDTVKATYFHQVQENRAVAVGIARKLSTKENTFTVGGGYVINRRTGVKAKLNHHGTLDTLLLHEVLPMTLLTLSGSVDTLAKEEKSPRIGLALSINP
ncbi:hypothetical protein ACH5RR_027093 [Cinchona calisaya]|uniref:Uncharacterized protein n=1 Tax=Cinchona calisaya TaxID=153742 RepID=A0ABD2Z6B5_9GENT